MTKSVTHLYNLALSAVGVRSKVSSPSDTGVAVEMCNLWYDTVRDAVLRAAHWPSCRAHARLALLAERDFNAAWDNDDPGPTWKYAYSLPSDILAPRYLSTFSRFSLELYRGGEEGDRNALMTDVEDAILFYTARTTDVSMWDDALYMAVAYGLAAHIGPGLKAKRLAAERVLGRANDLITEARTHAANDGEDEYGSIAPWIEARGYGESHLRTRFFFPYGPLLSGSVAVSEGA